jgi:hypothetical protein
LFEGFRRHEHDDDRSDLGSELEAERSRHCVVIISWSSADKQGSFAIFASEAEPRLDDRWEDQDANRLVGKLASASNLVEEIVEGGMNAGIEVSFPEGITPLGLRHRCYNQKEIEP